MTFISLESQHIAVTTEIGTCGWYR